MLGHGAFAGYFKLDAKRGIKVYGCSPNCERGYDFKENVPVDEARRDYKLMRSLRTRLVPKAYELVYVKRFGLWYVGIIMQHCQGTTLRDAFKGWRTKLKMIDSIALEFERKTGYGHIDLHDRNIMYDKKTKKYKVIDIQDKFISLRTLGTLISAKRVNAVR